MAKHGKTRKSISKRFVIKKGKVLHRTSGQDHFNSRESGKVTRHKRLNRELSITLSKTIRSAVAR